MRIPDEVTRIYRRSGPFATAYLDATRASERGAEEVVLRWQALRRDLERAGADAQVLTALDGAVGSHRDIAGEHGQVLVATGGELLMDETLPRPPLRPEARWAPLPHVMPYLAQQGPRIAHVVVVADRAGADLSAVDAVAAATGAPPKRESVEGSHDPLHKTFTGELSEGHFQQYVQNNWAANAREVSAAVRGYVARSGATLVVLAGDEHARALLRADLPPVLPSDVEIAEVREGGRGEGASERLLDEAVQGLLLQRGVRERARALERLAEARAHGLAAIGLDQVIDALRRAQVDTLIFVDGSTSSELVWVGPQRLLLARDEDDLRSLGVADPLRDRFDAAVIRALAGSSASLLTVSPDDVGLPDGVAAVLRYSDAGAASAAERG
jgi:hypothetical protein